MIYTLIQRQKTDSGTNWVNWGIPGRPGTIQGNIAKLQ